jgi:ribonuclease Y
MGSGIFWIEVFAFVMLGVFLGYGVRLRMSKKMLESSENLSARIIAEAKKEAETIRKESILQAKDNLLKVKADLEKETREQKTEFDALEKRIRQKEENLEKRMDIMVQRSRISRKGSAA